MPRILVCAATRTEAGSAREGIRRSGLEGRFDLLVTGIGPNRAAQALEARIRSIAPRERPERVVSTGFAGSWSTELRAGEWIEARRVCDENGSGIELTEREPAGPARAAVLCSVQKILASPPTTLLDVLNGSGSGLPLAVDMETYSLARVAGSFGIPFSAHRYLTDSLDAPLPGFVRHFTLALAPGSNDRFRARMGAIGEGTREVLAHPSSALSFLRETARWREALACGWAELARAYY